MAKTRLHKPRKHGRLWRIRWTDATGKRRRESFADYQDALVALKRHRLETLEIQRGERSPRPADRTFADACDYWIEKRVPLKRSGRDDRYMIERHLRPTFGHLLLREITVAHTDAYCLSRVHLAKKTVVNHLTLLIAMLNTAVDLGWLQRAPRVKKPKTRLISSDYRWLRTEEEILRFLQAARAEGEQVFVFYAMAVYTGLRAGELAALHWEDVSFKRRQLTVHRSFHGPTKAEDVRHVPILDPLLPVLRQWRLRHPGRLVFTNQTGGMYQSAARIFQEVLHRVLLAAGFAEVRENGRVRRYITFHGLRHTFASFWVMNGGDLFKLQKILGHKTVQMTMRYSHLQPEAYVADYGRLGDALSIDDAPIRVLGQAEPTATAKCSSTTHTRRR